MFLREDVWKGFRGRERLYGDKTDYTVEGESDSLLGLNESISQRITRNRSLGFINR